LLQFVSLPVIASSAIESMKLTRSFQIDRILSQSVTILSGELGYRTDSTTGIDISQQNESCCYSQVLSLVIEPCCFFFVAVFIFRTRIFI
jgi:hypothetical protein